MHENRSCLKLLQKHLIVRLYEKSKREDRNTNIEMRKRAAKKEKVTLAREGYIILERTET